MKAILNADFQTQHMQSWTIFAAERASLKRASVAAVLIAAERASKRSSSLYDWCSRQSKSKFLASLWILVVRILYAQLFTIIPFHYHVCDGL